MVAVVEAISGADSEDDIWLDADVPMNADIERAHAKQGFLDGISAAQASSLQDGFDSAYPIGASLGVDVGMILARIACMRDDDVLQEASRDLAIANVLHKMYFNKDLDLSSPTHPLIEKWMDRLHS